MNPKELSETSLKKIGKIFFITLIIISLTSIYFIKEFLLLQYYPVKVQFNFIGDLKKGADVRFIGGVRVGFVKKIYAIGSKLEVLLYIDEQFKIRENASLSLFTIGMMGERFINIEQNEFSGNFAPPGTTLVGNDALSLEIFQIRLAQLTKDIMENPSGQIPPSFNTIMNNFNNDLALYVTMIKNMQQKTGNDLENYRIKSQQVLKNVQNAKTFLMKVKSDIHGFNKKDINKFFISLKNLNNDLNNLNQSLDNLTQFNKNFKQETIAIRNKKNIVGTLIYDKKYYNDLKKKISRFESFSEDIADNPNRLIAK